MLSRRAVIAGAMAISISKATSSFGEDAVVAKGATTRPNATGIDMWIAAARPQFMRGDRVDLLIRIANRTDKPCLLLDIGSVPVEASYEVNARWGEKAQHIVPSTFASKNLDDIKSHSMLVPPKHVLEETVCLSTMRDMSLEGKYSVRLSRKAKVGDQSWELLEWEPLPSNEIVIDVIGSPLNRSQPRPMKGTTGEE